MESFRTYHGITFNVTVTWTFKRGGVAVHNNPITWTQKITKEPYQHFEVTPPIGETREFEVGALMHMMHKDVSITNRHPARGRI